MRKLRAALAVLAGFALVAPATAARADDQSDVGDGRRACSTGEICFQWIWDNFTTSTFQRHFWWNDGNHSDNRWHSIPEGYPSLIIRDSIEGIYNRDTECAIWLKDINSSGSWVYYSVTLRNQKENAGANKNNAHERC